MKTNTRALREKQTPPALYTVPAIMLIGSLLPFPYVYYQLLRLVVATTAGYIAFLKYRKNEEISVIVIIFAFIALLFNPITPVHLTKELWVPIDLAVACVYFGYWRKNRRI